MYQCNDNHKLGDTMYQFICKANAIQSICLSTDLVLFQITFSCLIYAFLSNHFLFGKHNMIGMY